MSPRSQPIAQRVRTITLQIARLQEQLSSKTRNNFTSDFHYRSWLEKTNDLLAELESELSVLIDPGEYDQIPPAVVAEELGITVNKVRLLIKGGEILASGKPAHEYVSRMELASACEMGVKELLRRLNQEAKEIFEESVAYLHQGQLQLAERAYRRLLARESIVGTYTLPYETALLLAQADLDEVDTRLRFIRRTEAAERARFISNLRRILCDMNFQNEAVKAITERVLYGGEAQNVDSHKVFGSKLNDLQQTAMFITVVVFDEIDRRRKRSLQVGQREELRGIIQSAVYSSLHALESYERFASSREFVDAIRVLMPRYYKPARLIGNLVRDHES
jgi:hypothetical protein